MHCILIIVDSSRRPPAEKEEIKQMSDYRPLQHNLTPKRNLRLIRTESTPEQNSNSRRGNLAWASSWADGIQWCGM
jgi:hypothetical protein